MTKGVDTALYLMLLRYLNRQYAHVFRLADSVATDTKYKSSSATIFKYFTRMGDDFHPDAHACRLKISLVTNDSGMNSPWDLTLEAARYTLKSNHTYVVCRLKDEEEIQLLDSEDIVLDRESPNYDPKKHHLYFCTDVKNRLYELKAKANANVRKPTFRSRSLEETDATEKGRDERWKKIY